LTFLKVPAVLFVLKRAARSAGWIMDAMMTGRLTGFLAAVSATNSYCSIHPSN